MDLKRQYRVFRRSRIVRTCLQSVFKVIHPMYMQFFWWPTAYCIRKFLPSPNKKDWERRILIIADDGIGDIVMSSGTIKYLKKLLQDKEIYILVREGLEPLFTNHADFILSFNLGDYFQKTFYKWHFLKKMRNIGFSVAVSGMLRRNDIVDDILISLGAKEAIAYEGLGIELQSSQQMIKKYQNKFSKFIPSMDRKGSKGDFLSKASEHIKYYYSKAFDIVIDEISPLIYSSYQDEGSRRKLLCHWHLKKHRYFTIGVGARAAGRIWPPQRYKQIASWIIKNTGLFPVLIGGKGEENLGFELSNDDGKVINLIGKLSLNESLAVLENAAFFIGNDSGPMHLSAALKVPTVALFGGGHFGLCFPHGDQHEIIYNKMDCYFCNWKCKYRNLTLDAAPCIEGITIDLVKSGLINFFTKNRNYFNSIDYHLLKPKLDNLFYVE